MSKTVEERLEIALLAASCAAHRAAQHEPGVVVWFWATIFVRFDVLLLTPAQRSHLEDALARVVPKPTVEQKMAARAADPQDE